MGGDHPALAPVDDPDPFSSPLSTLSKFHPPPLSPTPPVSAPSPPASPPLTRLLKRFTRGVLGGGPAAEVVPLGNWRKYPRTRQTTPARREREEEEDLKKWRNMEGVLVGPVTPRRPEVDSPVLTIRSLTGLASGQ